MLFPGLTFPGGRVHLLQQITEFLEILFSTAAAADFFSRRVADHQAEGEHEEHRGGNPGVDGGAARFTGAGLSERYLRQCVAESKYYI
jgi:hypothetical protein